MEPPASGGQNGVTNDDVARDGPPKIARASPAHKASCDSIQWRLHSEVALELSKSDGIMAIHDLVDKDNVHLMVVGPGWAVIQGRVDQITKMKEKVLESWGGLREEGITCSSYPISGRACLLRRQKERIGGLLDIEFKHMPMDWIDADKLLNRVFTSSDEKPLEI
ncbi:hypothetical protein F5Y11DRAFT_338433 [Daldinia sp. FL1419]|nr:hypothetical protein F5Y11DRAFT_338433 [Daldinia sp. FL1419]